MAETRKDVTVSKGQIQKAPPARVVSPFDDIERMFDDFLGRRWLQPFRWERPFTAEFAAITPKVDVVDRDSEVLVRVEVPGVKKEDLEVSISGTMLTVKGETKHEEKEEKGDYHRAEMSRGAFVRTLTLPAEVDEAKAKSSLKEGVLELTLPKIEQSKRRAIKID